MKNQIEIIKDTYFGAEVEREVGFNSKAVYTKNGKMYSVEYIIDFPWGNHEGDINFPRKQTQGGKVLKGIYEVLYNKHITHTVFCFFYVFIFLFNFIYIINTLL